MVARPGVVQAARTGRDKPVPYNARAGVVREFGTGRDKPVPYSARAGTVREFALRDLRADAAGHGRHYPGPPFHSGSGGCGAPDRRARSRPPMLRAATFAILTFCATGISCPQLLIPSQ